MSIENISDTARWVAVYRAMETERPDAIFRDPYARRLAGERGEEIVSSIKRGRSTAWAMIVRTAVMDELILASVATRGIDVIVNLAAGLDARPWRLKLPATLRWVDVDLPEILAYKRSIIGDAPPVCRYEAVATDLTDDEERAALFARLGAYGSKALVVTEGLLIYLEREQVAALATALRAVPSFRWWLIDLANPALLKMVERDWGKTLSKGNAPFKFAPAEGTAFFASAGWRQAEYRSTMEEARRLKREMPMMWLWRFFMRLAKPARREEMRRMSGVVLLERDGSGPA